MHTQDPGDPPVPDSSPDQERERRLELLVRRLPDGIQSTVRWLHRPAARWVRIPAGLLLMAASLLSILPIFGLWMLPLGLVLLAEDAAAAACHRSHPGLDRAPPSALAGARPHFAAPPHAV